MQSITVKNLKEMLAVADDCARVVIEFKSDTFRTFDVRCTSPIGEVALVCKDGTNNYIKELEGDLEKLEAEKAQLAEDINEKLETLRGLVQESVSATTLLDDIEHLLK